jgi:hypothetical protein
MASALNIASRKVGGLRFLRIGRLTISWSISAAYRPFPALDARKARKRRITERMMQTAFERGMRAGRLTAEREAR